MEQKKHEFCKVNEAKSREVCEALIKKFSGEHEAALRQGAYTNRGGHEKFKKDLKEIEEKYNMEPGKGVQAAAVLQEYLASKESIGITILKSDEALTEKEKELEEENTRKKVQEMEQKVKELEELKKTEKSKDQQISVEKNMMGVLEKIAEERELMRCELRRVIAEKERERDSYMKQGMQKQAMMYQAQIDDCQEKVESQEPEWYAPIVDKFKSVVSYIAPTIINLAGKAVKTKAIRKWREFKSSNKS
ncbi:hypothetical protein GDO81_018755 [Engystomops pustulosus]|uniref:Guanylate-binding protein/Atlastin C-terminal domain-containing protein n=1 Tax=Engystomops pustulosus TaxID=76066 RepID=A0AAV6YTI8_ENGPU|nr:hypothetical protein GDO81_018755 [Engystomops pustulosus]